MSTRLTQHDVAELRSDILNALASGRLNAWQTKFFNDVDRKLARFGTGTRLSEKQWAALRKGLDGVRQPSSKAVTSYRKPTGRKCSTPKLRPGFLRPNGFALIAIVGLAIIGSFNSEMGVHINRGLATVTSTASAEPITLDRSSFTVTDGDTIRLNGSQAGTRLVGFNTPETVRPRCDRGLQLGNEAHRQIAEPRSERLYDRP